MSYSFGVRAANKSAAKSQVAAELAKVVLAQPIHARDQAQAQAAVDSIIELLRDDDTMDVAVNVSGSVSWVADESLNSANVSVSAYLADKAP